MLQPYLNERGRFYTYLVFTVVAVALLAARAGFATYGEDIPLALQAFENVALVLGAAFGWTAASHTNRAPAGEHREPEQF